MSGRYRSAQRPTSVRDRTPGRGSVLAAASSITASYLGVRSGRARGLDRAAARALSRPLGHRADVLIAAGTDLGSVYGIAGLATVLAATGRRRAALDVAVAGTIAWTAAQASKPLIARERPYVADGVARLVATPAGTSWPSGHVAVAAALATTLGDHLPPSAARLTHVAVGGVAVSRCYVGVHHLTDVVAGWGVGVLAAAAWSPARRVTRRAVRRLRPPR